MKIKLGVFFGGNSTEHEVSIITAIQAIENMDTDKYDIIPIYIAKTNEMYVGELVKDISNYRNVENLKANSTKVTLELKGDKVYLIRTNKKLFEKAEYDYIDIAFPIVHGTNVEDGCLAGFIKMFGLPYVGCDVLASSVGMDKYVSKCVLKDHGIPVLDCLVFTANEYNEDSKKIEKKIKDEIKLPVIVKPINLGSSVGIKVAKTDEELEDALDNAFQFSKKILVERAIMNLKEVNCSVIGDYENAEASELESPIKTDTILSFKDKYLSNGGSKKLGTKQGGSKSVHMNAGGGLELPAKISKEQKDEIQKLAIKTFKAIGCNGVIRIDFMIDQDCGKIYVNELNTIPGSLSFHLWKAKGLSYKDELNKIIDLGMKRYREEKSITYSFDSNILANVSNEALRGNNHKNGK